MRDFAKYAIGPAKFLLPNESIDMEKWAVIACDQFTSQPDYWENVRRVRRGSPSALDIVYPEAWLDQGDRRIAQINAQMEIYARTVLTREVEGFILVERETSDGLRIGLLAVVDLEKYDFSLESKSAVRPTEGTVAERVPPRVQIRSGASLEAGHVLLLADDRQCTLIEPVYAARDQMPLLYDFRLMLGGGHIRGWQVGKEWYGGILNALEKLHAAGDGLDFAVGDGNHSLAAAGACWNTIRSELTEEEREHHPARRAMVEINNLHAKSMVFHPIHRALFGACDTLLQDFRVWLRKGDMDILPCENSAADLKMNGIAYRLVNRRVPLPVGVLQPFLDTWLKEHADVRIDYIHGDEELDRLRSTGAYTIWLPAMDKADLFPSVRIAPLPRKTFSMGEAQDKRYYLETRRIR